MNIVYIQNRASKAGAQHALKRLVTNQKMQKHFIVVITSEKGWLTQELKKYNHIKVLVENFPSSRSLTARIYQNRTWAKRIKKRLEKLDFSPDIIQANEYIENLLTLELSGLYGCKSAVFFRSALMKEKDFYKYRCEKNDIKIAVSDQLREEINSFYKGDVEIVYDFLNNDEFYTPKPKSRNFPKKILVIGNPHPNKGWHIAIEAIKKFAKIYPAVVEEVHFTGKPTSNTKEKIENIKLVFNEKFKNLALSARDFDLVISPSKYESFGLANLEVLAAGVLLLSSKRGVVAKLLDEEFLFEPNIEELYKKLEHLYTNWDKIETNLDKIQKKIKKIFSDTNVAKLLDIYLKVLNWTKRG